MFIFFSFSLDSDYYQSEPIFEEMSSFDRRAFVEPNIKQIP